jgi:hypothetical protein
MTIICLVISAVLLWAMAAIAVSVLFGRAADTMGHERPDRRKHPRAENYRPPYADL